MKKIFAALLLALLASGTRAEQQPEKTPAFPGAEGYGRYVTGGRGGKVYHVTNLNDSGTGSFRWACDQAGPRTIVFDVCGTIHLKSQLKLRHGDVTIAGQTAPGDGICVADWDFSIAAPNVIVRYMRFRPSDTSGGEPDGLGGMDGKNIIVDHCSCYWGMDENISIYRHMYDPSEGQYTAKREKRPAVNVTIQNTISAEALDPYNNGCGSTLGGENAAFIRNLWANNPKRNPSIGWNGVFNMVNNVVFNWGHRTVDGGDYTALYNIINNYYKPGPATPKDEPVGWRILKPEAGRSKLNYKQYGRVYADGNVMEGYPEITADNWKGGIQIETQGDTEGHTARMRAAEPFAMPYMRIVSAEEAYNHVLEQVGATIPCRDAVDRRVVEEVRTGKIVYNKEMPEDGYIGDLPFVRPNMRDTDGSYKYRRHSKKSYTYGLITDIRQVGGQPEYGPYTPYVDTDKDGMPDEWEKQNGLNPNDPTDANGDCTGDGYTNIEKYINGITTKVKVDWRNLNNNYDTLAEKGSLM